jgi:hypothetical protein
MLAFVRTTLLLLTLLVGLTAYAEESPKYDLKYKFKAGEVLRSTVLHKATVETTIQGNRQTAETRTTSVKAWKVSDVKPDGTTTFVHMVESIDMWHKMQGRQEMRYNSLTDKVPPQGFEDAAKRVGIPLSVITMDERGKVLHRDEKLDKATTNPTPITVPMPAEPVEIGHEWTSPYAITLQTPSGGMKNIELRQSYSLKSVQTGVATISVETQVLTPLSDPGLEAQLIQHMTNGNLKFDVDAGRLISQVTDLDRRVIGFNGPASSMHYLTRVEETMLSDNDRTAAKPKTILNPAALDKPAPIAKPTLATPAPPTKPTTRKPPIAAKPKANAKSPIAAKPAPPAKAKTAAKRPPSTATPHTATKPQSSRKAK